MENELLHRIKIGELERLKSEKREGIASLRSRVIRLIEENGKEKDHRSGPDLLPRYFDGSFLTDNIRVRFLLQADNVDPNQADKISVSFLALKETISIDSDGKCEIRVDSEITPGKVNTTISPATHYQITQYSEMLRLIEEKYSPQELPEV